MLSGSLAYLRIDRNHEVFRRLSEWEVFQIENKFDKISRKHDIPALIKKFREELDNHRWGHPESLLADFISAKSLEPAGFDNKKTIKHMMGRSWQTVCKQQALTLFSQTPEQPADPKSPVHTPAHVTKTIVL